MQCWKHVLADINATFEAQETLLDGSPECRFVCFIQEST